MCLHRLRSLLPDGTQLAAVKGAGVLAARVEHLKEDVDRIRRREDDERGAVEVGDRLTHVIVGRHRTDLDGGNLDHRGSKVRQLAAERLHLVPGARDEDAAAVQRAPGEGIEALGHFDPGTDHQQGIAPQSVGGRLARQLTQGGRHAPLPWKAGAEDQRGWGLRRTAVRQQLRDSRFPPPGGEPEHDSLRPLDQPEPDRHRTTLDGQRDATHHRRRHLHRHSRHRLEVDARPFQTRSDLGAIRKCIRIAGEQHSHLAAAPGEPHYLVHRLEAGHVCAQGREMQ